MRLPWTLPARRSAATGVGTVGHLWQGRFASCLLDLPHVLAVARYIELNPVRARLAAAPEDWPWSSARAHLAGRDDGLVTTAPLLEAAGDWSADPRSIQPSVPRTVTLSLSHSRGALHHCLENLSAEPPP
jgi:hypothetical protein